MIQHLLSKNILFRLTFLALASHLISIIHAGHPEADKIQAEYYKDPPKIPNVPLDTPEPTSKEVYAYLYCSRPSIDTSNSYFDALRIGIFRLKAINDYYDPNPKDIVVLVCSYTEQWQIEEIKKLGVIVMAVDPIIPTGPLADNPAYIDQYTKIHLWRLVKWERLFYLDIDSFLLPDFITIWDEPAAQIKTEPKDPNDKDLYPYLFAAVEDLAQRRAGWKDNYFNAGVFMIKPDMKYFKKLLDGMNDDTSGRDFMEQEYFNHVYRTNGPIPAARFPTVYNHFVEFSDEFEKGTKIFHIKIWSRSNKKVQRYQDLYFEDLNHLFNNKALDLARVYEIDDLFLMDTPNKEAYVFLLNINDQDEKDYFMAFQVLKLSITQINEYQKNSNTGRDIVVMTIEDIPTWQIQELQKLGALVVRVKHEKKGKAKWSDDYLRVTLWRLIHWERLLYIDKDIFINNKKFINIWNENSTQIQTKPIESSKQPLYNVPAENVKGFYPYVLSAARESENGKFNSGMFIFKPSIRHYNYLMSLFNDGVYGKDQDLLNYAYGQDTPISSSTFNQSYNTLSIYKDSSVTDIKAVNGKIWTHKEKGDYTPFATKFWESFIKFTLEQDSHKIFGENNVPANCQSGSNSTRCDTCDPEYDYIEYPKADYMICPAGIPFGKTLDWFELGPQCRSLSTQCELCIKDGKCSYCESGLIFRHSCVISPIINSDIIGYCSPSSEAGMSYIAKGSICASRLTRAKILKRALICTAFVLIVVSVLLLARCFVMRLVRRFRKKNYTKFDEDNFTEKGSVAETPGTSKSFKPENNV